MRVCWRHLALLFVPAVCTAQEPISFTEAARRTLADRPEFRVYASRMDTVSAQRAQAGQRPGYELGIELENALGTGDLSGAKGAELTVTLSRVFERGGKRAARIDVVDRSSEVVASEREVMMLDLVAETARQFVALAVAQQRLADSQAAVAQARQSLKLTRQRHAGAQVPELEVLNSAILFAETELAVDNAQRAVVQAQQLLGAQWGDPGATPVAELDIYAMSKPVEAAVLLDRLEQTPDLRRYASDTRVAEAELALARTQARADLTFYGGVRRLEELDDQALVFGLSIPLGSASRAQPVIRERAARIAQVDAERAVTQLRLEGLLRRQVLALQGAYATEQIVRERQLVQAQQVVEQTRHGFSIGRFAYRDLAIAERQLRDLQRQRLEAASAYHLTRVEIERLTGVLPVETAATEPRND